jgi:hypothetical protein
MKSDPGLDRNARTARSDGFIKYAGQPVALGLLLVSAACTAPTWPSEADINAAIAEQEDQALRSVSGLWWGSAGEGAIRLEVSLTQAPDGTVQGAGTLRDRSADAVVPITVTGRYERPTVYLTFRGMQYEGRTVEGDFMGTNTPFLGASGTLKLTAEGYEASVRLGLHRGPLPAASLTGRVTDAVTGSPVTGATVSVQGTSVTTSATGHYVFSPSLAAGRHQVTVSHPQYVTLTRDVELAPFAVADFRLPPN